ncbi:MAG: hypothetical protein KIG95_03495 [Comamonas sp.]|nr:hypothetical protein [Comamonas sp.]
MNQEHTDPYHCKNCGERLHGSGYSDPVRCPNADEDDWSFSAPDEGPFYCRADAADEIEHLQAECERLRKLLQHMIDQTTPLVPEPGNPMWSRRIQLDEVIAERDQLRAECEQLRKDAARYGWLMQDRHEWPEKVEHAIKYQDKPRIDAAIDAAMQGAQP